MNEENLTAESAAEPNSADPTVDAVAAERDLLAAERAELQDLLLRRQAEFDNFRRRVEREKSELRDYAAEEAVRALLPVLDDFERALKTVPDEEGPLRDYAQGMDLIRQRLDATLSKLGLERLESKGAAFDPNLHEAIQRQQTEDAADGTILEEYQTGYRFKGRLLRPAMVKVAVHS
ncbi:MAG: nucleotide exchange factor GrpE [Bryobacteraceae bacterium]